MSTTASRLRIAAYLGTLASFCTVITRVELVDYEQYHHDLIHHFGRYKYRFLTTWNFIMLSAHALLALYCEFLTERSGRRKIKNLKLILSLRDALFTSVVFPVSLLVTSVFWGLYAVDRELIFPTFLEPVLPPFDNHAMHTAIVPLVLWEAALQPRSPPTSHARNLMFMSGFFACYSVPFLGTYFVHGQYLYPFVELMSPFVFIAFCALLWAYTVMLYRLQWPLVSLMWSSKRSSESRKVR